MEIKKAMCWWCKARCRVAVYVENQHLVKVEPDPDFPMPIWPPTKACVRRMAAKEWFYHPERVNYPLKRAGEKGEGKWQQISWEQALDEIAAKLSQIKKVYGAEAVVNTSGTGRTHEEFRGRFFNLFGSPNQIGQPHICHGPRAGLSKAILGWFPYIVPDPIASKQSNCYIVWGMAPEVSWPAQWNQVRSAHKAGKKIIVVDPRFTESASMATLFLQIRPGTDCALALAMINVIIEEELYDKEFVTRWCYGFEPLRKRAREYPPEKVAGITWIDADKIRQAARMYATNKPAIIMDGMGIEHLENNAEFIHARYILPAITGNINVPGGEVIVGSHPKYIPDPGIELVDMLSPEQKKKKIGADQYRVWSFEGFELIASYVKKAWGKDSGISFTHYQAPAPLVYRAIVTGKPYPIRAMITSASNPMVTQSNVKLVYKALKSLDLYVVMDFWKTPSAELADYVLPAGCWLERPYIWNSANSYNNLIAAERALPTTIPGEYDHRLDYDFWRELGIRLGQKKYWTWKTLEDYYDYRLAPLEMTLAEFMKRGGKDFPPIDYKIYEKIGFGTATGKIELYSTIFEKLGYDPLPVFREPSVSPVSQPQLAKEYPLILITGARHNPFWHSEWRNINSLRKRHPDPIVQIHPETAKKAGIADGDWVWIETRIGRVRQKCRYFEGMNPQVVSAQHGWWFPELPGEEPWLHGVWESNINVCVDDNPEHLNPLIGSWPLKAELCKVYKVKEF